MSPRRYSRRPGSEEKPRKHRPPFALPPQLLQTYLMGRSSGRGHAAAIADEADDGHGHRRLVGLRSVLPAKLSVRHDGLEVSWSAERSELTPWHEVRVEQLGPTLRGEVVWCHSGGIPIVGRYENGEALLDEIKRRSWNNAAGPTDTPWKDVLDLPPELTVEQTWSEPAVWRLLAATALTVLFLWLLSPPRPALGLISLAALSWLIYGTMGKITIDDSGLLIRQNGRTTDVPWSRLLQVSARTNEQWTEWQLVTVERTFVFSVPEHSPIRDVLKSARRNLREGRSRAAEPRDVPPGALSRISGDFGALSGDRGLSVSDRTPPDP